jgi:hypothetical protein
VRTAFLPASAEGDLLLKRLEYAFLHGLTFTVGTSISMGTPNVVTWASIEHKTALTGGAKYYGYPDSSYVELCHASLSSLGVPDML